MRFFRILHISSLDVVFGAIAMQAMLWNVMVGGMQPWSEQVVLGISVWIFYLADRQLDNSIHRPSDSIHLFHDRYPLFVRGLLLVLLICLGILLAFLSADIIRLGICLTIGMVIYGSILRYWDRIWLPKELFTSLLYAAGLFLPSYAAGKSSWLLFIHVVLLALMNLSLFSWLEGKLKFRTIFIYLQFALMAILPGICWFFEWELAICLAIIQGIHVGIYYFSPNLQYRWVGELAFISPVIYFVYELF
jgi:hypothetical protein